MKSKKTLLLPIFSLFSVASLSAQENFVPSKSIYFLNGSHKTYRQIDVSDNQNLIEADFTSALADGLFIYGCSRTRYFAPSTACPLGATGYYLGSPPTLDQTTLGNAEASAGPYFEISRVIPHAVFESYRADEFELVAAPASDLVRPQKGFSDLSDNYLYNIRTTGLMKEYKWVNYKKVLSYAQNKDYDRLRAEIRPGSYLYKVPLKSPIYADFANSGYVPQVGHLVADLLPFVEPIDYYNNFADGFRFTKAAAPGDTDVIRFNADGFAQLNPNQDLEFKWNAGGSLNNVDGLKAADRAYFGLRGFNGGTGSSELPSADYIYPQFVDEENLAVDAIQESEIQNTKILLGSPYTARYIVGRGAYSRGAYTSRQNAIAEVSYLRLINTRGVSYDNSSRGFELPITFLDTYASFAELHFGNNTVNVGLFDDFDGDGASNASEWQQLTDPSGNTVFPDVLPSLRPTITFTDTNPDDLLLPPDAIPTAMGYTYDISPDREPVLDFRVERSDDGGTHWYPENYIPMTPSAIETSPASYVPVVSGAWTIYRVGNRVYVRLNTGGDAEGYYVNAATQTAGAPTTANRVRHATRFRLRAVPSYSYFASQSFPAGAANVGPNDDFDADGLNNVTEWANSLGSNHGGLGVADYGIWDIGGNVVPAGGVPPYVGTTMLPWVNQTNPAVADATGLQTQRNQIEYNRILPNGNPAGSLNYRSVNKTDAGFGYDFLVTRSTSLPGLVHELQVSVDNGVTWAQAANYPTVVGDAATAGGALKVPTAYVRVQSSAVTTPGWSSIYYRHGDLVTVRTSAAPSLIAQGYRFRWVTTAP